METPHSASIISATGGQHEDPVVIDRVEGMKYRVGWLTRADLLEEGRIGLAGARSAVNHDGGSMVPPRRSTAIHAVPGPQAGAPVVRRSSGATRPETGLAT
jgi:hypothetical protein